MDEKALRELLRKLVQAGRLSRKEEWERSRSPHSTKKTTLYYRLPTLAHWNQVKADPQKYLLSRD